MHPKFYDENPSGIIITRYITDPATASNGLITQLKTIVTTLCSSIGLVAVMLYSSWQLAIVGVMVLVFAFLPLSLLRKRIKKTSNKNMQISGNMTTCMNETYSGNKVMAAYKLQDRQYNYFAGQVRDFFNVNISLAKRIAWMHPLTHFIASIGIAVVLGYGTYLINSGHITSGSFASFIASLLLLYKPVKSLGNSLTNMQTIFVAMSRILELFDLESEIKEADKAQASARALFGGGGNTENMPTTALADDDFSDGTIGILDLLVKCSLAASKGEGRRLVQQGGVSVNDEKITDASYLISADAFADGVIVKKGKKVIIKFVVE